MKKIEFQRGRYNVKILLGYIENEKIASVTYENNAYSFSFADKESFEREFCNATNYIRKHPVKQIVLTERIARIEEKAIAKLV